MKPTAEAFFCTFSNLVGVTLILLALSSCDHWGLNREVRIKMPPRPEIWLEQEITAQVTYWIDNDFFIYPGGFDSEQFILVPPSHTLVVLFLPNLGSFDLKPAGGFYIPGQEKPEVNLTWEDGWIASGLLNLQSAGARLEYLNIPHLSESFSKRRNGESPWHFDLGFFMGQMKNLSVGYPGFRKNLWESTLFIPEGIWIPGDPFESLKIGGTFQKLVLPQGINTFWNQKKILKLDVQSLDPWAIFLAKFSIN